MKFTLKKKIVAGGVAAALALGGGIAAYAFFTAGGAGTGTGSTASAANTTLNVAFPVVNLGATVTATTASITNPSTTGSVSVTGQTLTLVSADCTIGAGTPVTATTGWFTLGGTAAPTAPIAAGATVDFAGPVTLTLNNDPAVNQDVCQGATVALHLILAP
jgi:hypothetical protein